MSPELLTKIEHQLNSYAAAIDRLNMSEENFEDWFDAQLFNPNAAHPSAYVGEMRGILRRLQQTHDPIVQEQLSERLAQQLSALDQALRYYQARN